MDHKLSHDFIDNFINLPEKPIDKLATKLSQKMTTDNPPCNI